MGKPKNTELNFLYMDDKYVAEENKRRKKLKKNKKLKIKKIM